MNANKVKTTTMNRVVLTSLFTMMFTMLALFFSFTSAQAWEMVGDDGANTVSGNYRPVGSDTVIRKEVSTGGRDSQEARIVCGKPYLQGHGSSYLLEDCWRNGSTYFAIRSDADIDNLSGRGRYGEGFTAYAICAADKKQAGGGTVDFKREQNGKTLVGVRVSFEYLAYRNLYTVGMDGDDTRVFSGRTAFTPDLARDFRADCIYQNWEDVSYNKICIVAVDLVVKKTAGQERTLSPKAHTRVNTSWGNGNRTLDACNRSNSVYGSLKYAPDTRDQKNFGQYKLDTVAFYQDVTIRTYRGAPAGHTRPPDEIVKVGKVKSRPGASSYGQITCDPNHSKVGTNRNSVFSGGPWTWTWSDCDPSNSEAPGAAAYRCTNSELATVNGLSGQKKATVYRNGEKNSLVWKNPSIGNAVGKNNLVSVSVKDTKVVRSGTPWNNPRTMPVGKNNVTLHTPSGTNVLAKNGTWMPGRQAAFDFTANWASNAGKPTVISPTWRFDAVLNTRGWRIDGVRTSFNNGSWTMSMDTSAINIPVRATASCSTSFAFDVVRSVNDAG